VTLSRFFSTKEQIFFFISEFPAFTAGTRKPGGEDRGIKLCVNSICRNGKIGFLDQFSKE
jgi:hypothetical protein